MKKILYISNIEVPYRVKLFNELARHCDLTVLYERRKSDNRNEKWTKSEDSLYKKEYLNGIKIGGDNSFSLRIIRKIFEGYDSIIVGCYNSPVQILLILLMKILHKPYILNLDGEIFAEGNGLKTRIKKFFLKGAKKYLVAGKQSGKSLRKVVGEKEIIPYYFSSLSNDELRENATALNERENFVLVVGQYLDVKGIDVALEAAKMNDKIKYKFIGMGSKTDEFVEKYCPNGLKNVEFIPFLQKKALEEEYKKCAVFVLPSRQECWGLVINEAASFGTPIVSTFGSGAAVEFLDGEYSRYLSVSGDSVSLYNCIMDILSADNSLYSRYLKEKSLLYSIENGVKAHIQACEI